MTSTRRLFSWLFLLLFVESLLLGWYFSTFLEGVIVGLAIISLPIWLLKTAPESAVTHHVVAAAVMLFSFLHIQQSFGLIEVHFEIFILMAVLIMFVQWRVFITALVLVAVHHLSFYFLQINNTGFYVFDADRLYFSTVLIHAVYAIVEATVAGYIAKALQRERRAGRSLSETTEQIMAREDEINIGLRADDKRSKAVQGFNQLLDSLAHVVQDVKSQTSVLKTQSNQLVAVHDELFNEAKMRAELTDQIALSGQRVEEGFTRVAEQSAMLSEQMEQIQQCTEQTLLSVDDADNKTNELSHNLTDTEHNITDLVDACHLISDLLSEISGIADQTNLLALNAAIEAARAGEQGRGFAVVADEVRNLAISSQKTTEKISETLTRLLNNSAKSTDSMKHSLIVIKELAEISQGMKEHINAMSEQVVSVSANAGLVADVVHQQTENTMTIAASSSQLKNRQVNEEQVVEKLTEKVQLIDVSLSVLESGIAKFR